jgi:predicted HTH domain antitoxin
MQVTLTIPDDLAAQLIPAGKDPSREALEALAIEGYRTERLTESEVRQMLGYETRMQVHALLAEHDVCLHYTVEDLQQDIDASNKLHAQRTSQATRAQ